MMDRTCLASQMYANLNNVGIDTRPQLEHCLSHHLPDLPTDSCTRIAHTPPLSLTGRILLLYPQ